MSDSRGTPAPAPSLPPADFGAALAALAGLQQRRSAQSYTAAGLALRVLYGADLAASELLRLHVRNVPRGGGHVEIIRKGEPVEAALTADGTTAVEELIGDRESGAPLVPGRARGRLSEDRLRDLWARALIAAELPHCPMSALRARQP